MAQSARFFHLTSFVFVVGEIAFFKGIESVSFDLTRSTQFDNNISFGML